MLFLFDFSITFAQRSSLIYNRAVSISLVYNYITHNFRSGVNKKMLTKEH